jgi:Zn-dependent protease
MDFSSEQIIRGLAGFVIVIISLSFHEWGHAVMADKFGDDTPRRMGRVTFNPLAHISPVGTVLLPLLALFINFPIVGWARPVCINPGNLPRNSQRAWVTIAGPGMNLLLAVIAAIAGGLLLRFGMAGAAGYVSMFMLININLMMFNTKLRSNI